MAAASGALAPLQNAINETIDYTRTRHAFGQPLLNNQYLHFRLAELQTELELFRALTYQAADAMERGEDITLYASMLKLKCGRLSREITDSCLQFWGGMGFTNEVDICQNCTYSHYQQLSSYNCNHGSGFSNLYVCNVR